MMLSAMPRPSSPAAAALHLPLSNFPKRSSMNPVPAAVSLISRRRALTLLGAAAALIGAALFGITPVRAEDPKPITVGFIYVGSHDDFGYNQAQAEGAAELVKQVSGVKI